MKNHLITLLILISTTLSAQNVEWLDFERSGYILPTYINLYNAELQEVGGMNVPELSPIQILQYTNKTYVANDITNDKACERAHFVKIILDNTSYYVYGKNIIYPLEEITSKDIKMVKCTSFEEISCTNQTADDFFFKNYFVVIDNNHQPHLVLDEASEYDKFTLEQTQDNFQKIKSIQPIKNQYQIGIVSASNSDLLEFYNVKLIHDNDMWFIKSNFNNAYTIDLHEKIDPNNMAESIHNHALQYQYNIENATSHEQKSKLSADYIAFMTQQIKAYPQIMQQNPFYLLTQQGAFKRSTSKDKKLSTYSFNNNTGGSMVSFDVIVQTQNQGKYHTYKLPKTSTQDDQFFVSQIHTLQAHQKPYYILIANVIASNRDMIQIAKAYSIQNQKLKPENLFRTTKKQYTEIPVAYDFFDAMDTHPERPIKLINYDQSTQQMYFPVVNQDKILTSKNLVYQWQGNYFEYLGIE